MVDEFPIIVPSTFGAFIGHLLGVLACVRCVVFKMSLKVFERFYSIAKICERRVGKNRVADVFKKGTLFKK